MPPRSISLPTASSPTFCTTLAARHITTTSLSPDPHGPPTDVSTTGPTPPTAVPIISPSTTHLTAPISLTSTGAVVTLVAPEKSNAVGAIAGGIVGGVVGLSLFTLVFLFLCRRKAPSPPSSAYDPMMASQNPTSFGA